MADPRLRNDGSDNWEVVGGIVPEVDNNKDLGKTTKQWKDIYFKGNLKDAANSLTLAQIMAHSARHLGGADDILVTLDARYLVEANNLSDLVNVATARSNLGLIAGGAGDIWVEKAGDIMSGDLLIYDPVNDANPQLRIGSADANEGHIQAVYDSGAQTLDYLLISTDSGGEGDIVFNAASGFHGIGVTAPTDKLDVAGGIRVTTNVAFAAGLAGRIYKSSVHGMCLQGVVGSSRDFSFFTPAGSHLFSNPTGTNDVTLIPAAAGAKAGVGIEAPLAKLHVDQFSTTGAIPVLTLDQADIDEDFFKFIGTSDTNVDRALVDAVDFPNIGALKGFLKINIQDDQGTNPIVDGDYYIPFYAVPTA